MKRQFFFPMFVLVFASGMVWPVGLAAQAAQRPPRPDIEARRAAMEQRLEALQAAAQAATEASLFVDAARGIDTPNCGSQAQPCRTISQGVRRAQALQKEPQAPAALLINVEVGPGTYTEAVDIKSGWIRLRGSGVGLSVLTNPGGYAVFLQSANPVFLEGFTISAGANLGAVQLWDLSVLQVTNGEIRDSQRGIYVVEGSKAVVRNSTFVNNSAAVIGDQHIQLRMRDVTITGQGSTVGTGVNLFDNCVGTLQRVTISQTQIAVLLYQSELWNFGSDTVTELNGNTLGIVAVDNSLLDFRAKILNNTDTGVFLDSGSVAVLLRATIDNNGTGVFVTGNSYLDMFRGGAHGNTTGVFFDLFSHGVLRLADVSGNGTDTATDRGGAFFVEP